MKCRALIIALLIGAAVLTCGQYKALAQSKPVGGLVDYWKFDEGVGRMASDCVGRYNGTLQPGDVWVPGIVNNALHFDGGPGAYVTLPPGVVRALTNFTICFWVKIDINAQWNRAFDFGTGTTAYMLFTPDSNTNSARYAITTGGNPAEQRIESTSPLSTGIWHHIAIVQFQSVGKLYIDGIKAGENDNMTLRPSDLGLTTLNYLGKSQWDPDPTLLGAIDEFRIYDVPLTATQVGALAHLTN